MKKLVILGLSSAFALGANAQTLEERVEALEYAGYENFLKVSGQLEVRYDTVTVDSKEDESNPLFAESKDTAQYWRSFMQIDTESNPSSKLSVYTRLQATKFMNGNGTTSSSVFPDLVDGQRNSLSAQPFFTRFFANYKFTENDIVTFGRLPTFNGTPFNIKRGEAQDGTYPIFAYNNMLDGVAYTRMIKTGETSNLALRAIYMPWTRMNNGEQVTAGTGNIDEDIEITTNIYSAMAEYNDEKPSWARRFNAVVQYLGVEGDVSADFTETDGTTKTNFRQKVDRTVVTAEAYGLMNSKWDLGLQYGHSVIRADGGFEISALSRTVGIYTDEPGEEVTGSMISGWVRYNVTNTDKVALLFAQGDNFYVNNSLTRDLVDIYSNQGLGYQLVWNHQFEGGMTSTLGFIHSQRDRNSIGQNVFGEPEDADITSQAVYTSFVANF